MYMNHVHDGHFETILLRHIQHGQNNARGWRVPPDADRPSAKTASATTTLKMHTPRSNILLLGVRDEQLVRYISHFVPS